MESLPPDGQPVPIEPEVIDIGDSDNDDPLLSQGQFSANKTPARSRELTGKLNEVPKQANLKATPGTGAAEILRRLDMTTREIKMEGKKAFRAHW